MEISLQDKNIFPSEVIELLQALYSVGFFDESLLIGSWVIPLYQKAFAQGAKTVVLALPGPGSFIFDASSQIRFPFS